MLQISPPAFDSVPDASSPGRALPFQATEFRISTSGFCCGPSRQKGSYRPFSTHLFPRRVLGLTSCLLGPRLHRGKAATGGAGKSRKKLLGFTFFVGSSPVGAVY